MTNKCACCGEPLIKVTDPKGQVWYICPLILYGDTERDHTSIYDWEYEEQNETNNILPDLSEIN